MTKRIALLIILVLNLSGCLYKIDIYQGNVLDPEQIDKLQTGMSKNEVISILGSPQLVDPFHTQRWDYYAMSNINNQSEKTERLLTLRFDSNTLTEIIRPAPLPAEKPEKKGLWGW